MSIQTKKTTLTLDDIQMIGEVVLDSEKRLQGQMDELKLTVATKDNLKSIVQKEDLKSIIEDVVGRVVEEKFKRVVGDFPKREDFHSRMASQAKTVQKVDQEQIVLTHQVQMLDKRVTILEKKAFT